MTMLEMAEEYRRAAAMIRLRIIALRAAAKTAPPGEKRALEERIYALAAMYRETCAVARVLENYYNRGYHIDEYYTV